MTRTKSKQTSASAPQTREEAEEWMSNLQKINVWIARRDAELRESSAKLKADAESEAKPKRDEKARLETGLYAWAEANREALTQGGKTKTVVLGTGEIKWRKNPPKVTVRGIPKILEFLRGNGLSRFIRIKEEIDKEAMLKEPTLAGTVPGVKIGSEGESIVVEPFESTLETAA